MQITERSKEEARPLQHVLIASNDAGIVDSIRTLVDPGPKARFYVDAANGLTQTLEKASLKVYDVLLLDLALDQADSLSTLRTLHSKIDVPIVILTQSGAETLSLKCLEEGAEEYLHKEDLTTPNLRRTIGYAISRHRANDLRLRLEHSDRLAALGQLTAGVAHEINNPATYVLGNLRQIEDVIASLIAGNGKPGDLELVADMTKDCRSGVDLIASISRELKFYARDDDDHAEVINIEELIANSSTMTLNEIRYRARFEKCISNVPDIKGSRSKLSQVLVNLLINAAHSIQSGTTKENCIRITADLEGSRVVIRVSDTGTGIPQNVINKIFKPYYTTKPHGQGTGLGLSICKEIIAQHKGELTVTSCESEGTTFTISLPANGKPRVANPRVFPSSSPSTPLKKTRRRILLIDDEPLLLKSLARMLQSHHSISSAIGGANGLACLRENEDFDVVICDLMMPEVDGLHVYDTLVNEFPHLVPKLIFLSGGVFTQRMSTFLEDLKPQLLDKPVGRDVLLEAIDCVPQ